MFKLRCGVVWVAPLANLINIVLTRADLQHCAGSVPTTQHCAGSFFFHHLEPRHPFETRWLTTDEMTAEEETALLQFYRDCVAEDVQDGGEFEIVFSHEFISAVEAGTSGIEGTKEYSMELAKVERLPGKYLQIGEWPNSAIGYAHRSALFKQRACTTAGAKNRFAARLGQTARTVWRC